MKLINLAVVAIVAAILVGLQDVNASKNVDYMNPVRSAQEDEVKDLPCLNNQSIKFKHYSGYLKAFEDGEQEQWLHYWFAESESNPATDPVLLWLDGGPGGSSLGQMFGKTGPFQFANAGNEFAWNKLANVLYLETPAGVGFSYSIEPLNIINDDTTAKSNYLALKSFMRKFPQFANNSLYLSGVSYAGTYLPTLGTLVDQDPEFNFKGVAIENGLFDLAKQKSSLIFFAYYHGLIGEGTWMEFSRACCHGKPPTRKACDNRLPMCILFEDKTSGQIKNSGISIQNVLHIHDTLKLAKGQDPVYEDYSSIGDSVSLRTDKIAPMVDESRQYSEKSSCSYKILKDYLGEEIVREKLHIPAQVREWQEMSWDVRRKYDLYYPDLPGGLTSKFKSLIKSSRNLTMLVYNGDLDMRCDFLGSRWFVEDLGGQILSKYEPWMYDGRVAGFVQHLDGITFATVRGAGHGASSDRPREGFAIMERFLNAKSRNVYL